MTTTDRETHEQIKNELGKDSPWHQKLNRALELGATPLVIEWITSTEVDGLPWINHLLQAGWSNEQVKNLFLAHCQNEYWGSEFQYAFTKNYDAWKLFDQPQELTEFLEKLPEQSLMSAEQIIIQWNDHFDDLMVRFGERQLYTVVEKAVRHLSRLSYNTRAVDALRDMERPLQRQAAARLYPDWNTIPFIVEVFKINDREDRRDHITWDAQRVMPSKHWPMEVPSAMRWALLGGLHIPNENGWYQDGDPGIQLKRAVEARDWCFARLEQITDPQTGRTALGVVHKNDYGQTTIYLHDNNGVRGDRPKVGDEVLVPKDPAKSLTNGPHVHAMKTLQPVHKDGKKTRVFKFELHPVAQPTPEMLEKPAFYFHGNDIIPPK